MLDLLQHYSVSQIIIFLVLICVAIKGIIDFYDWIHRKIEEVFNVKSSKNTQKEQLERRLAKGDTIMNELKQQQKNTNRIIQELTKKIDILIESDKDDIKAYITKEHHKFCYDKKWIDDFSLDCLERRYKHYEDEGGNSFIEGFMQELRSLPKHPPE